MRLLVALLFVGAGAVAVAAAPARTFGSGVGAGQVVTVQDLLADPAAYVGKKVRVTGRISAVCPAAGCWISITGEGAARPLRFKVEDGVIVFPADVRGKSVVAEGVLVKHEMSHEQALAHARHLAEERSEAFDPASVSGPMTLYEIQGAGAVVSEGP
jgi:hypothetical protein